MGRKREGEREAQRAYMKQQIEQHVPQMAWELNWRLICGIKTADSAAAAQEQELWNILHLAGQELLWEELCMPGHILWVEEVELTNISYPEEQLGMAASLIRRLKKVFANIAKFLLDKGRKGMKVPILQSVMKNITNK